ncbi:MAG: hypothetical protein K9G65_02720 [Rickettsiaceae bacterium]|nr:hypothetical protein [Rickettsiaceae bacterium]
MEKVLITSRLLRWQYSINRCFCASIEWPSSCSFVETRAKIIALVAFAVLSNI